MENLNRFLKGFDPHIQNVTKLNASGSGRVNYKIETDKNCFIYTENANIKENETFFYLSRLFQKLNGNVPEIIKISEDKTSYIQSFVGEKSLLDTRIAGEDTEDLYQKSIQQLLHFQIGASHIIDSSQLFDSKRFDAPLIYRDLFYFKNYFLDFSDVSYLQADLLKEFEQIVLNISNAHYIYVMLRDFQGRNIMVNHKTPFFIDYQDAMMGPIAYDLVSLLWQAKAKLSHEEKTAYYTVYTDRLKQLIPNKYNAKLFKSDYENCLLIRLLQVLGAYGKLGIIQGKPHFIESIQYGIQNLKVIQQHKFMAEFPTLRKIISQLNVDEIPKIKA